MNPSGKSGVNGVLENQTLVNKPLGSNTKVLFIGQHLGANDTFHYRFNGLVDEVELFNRALSDVEIGGIYNAGSAGKCKILIGANAGPSQTVNEGDIVNLDGTGSFPDPNTLNYSWTQVGGPTVVLTGANTSTPSFTAPFVLVGGATLTFALTVSDGELTSDPSVVNITVKNVNNLPIADAGEDQTLNEASPVMLDGSDSFDDDGEPLIFSWVQTAGTTVSLSDPNAETPTFTAPLVGTGGETLTFELTVSDGIDDSATSPVNVNVTNVNNAPVANAGPDQTVDEGNLVTLDGTESSDPESDPLTFLWVQVGSPTVILTGSSTASPTFTAPSVPSGGETLTFELTVSDGDLSDTDEVVIEVQNVNDPPACSLAMAVPKSIWPLNHKLVPIDIVGVTDPDNDTVAIAVTGVTQDEPVNGLGSGDTSPDAVLQDDGSVLIRAERSGMENGRVYRISFTAEDAIGASCTGSVKVTVPHSRKSTAVDSGDIFDSTPP